MQVEGMLAWIIVVEDDLDDLALLEDEGVRIAAVDCGIRGGVASRESRVKSWDLGLDVSDVVEEGTAWLARSRTY